MQVGNKILTEDIRFLKGVGPKRAIDFSRIGVRTIRDLIYLFPHRYEDRRWIQNISNLKINQVSTVRGRVVVTSLRRSRRGMGIFEAAVDDGTGIVLATWFNQSYLKDVIKKDVDILVYGKIDYYKKLRIISSDYEIIDGDEPDLGIVSVYPLSGKLNQKIMRKLIKGILDEFLSGLGEFIPYDIRMRFGLINRVKAMRNIHFPQDENIIYQARKRFAFEEIFLLQLAIGIKRLKRKYFSKGISHKFDFDLKKRFKDVLPFELTSDQDKVLERIEKDMSSSQPMNRLVQGEVGTGKTIVASYGALLTASGGYQAALMVPTEVLAQQQYIKISEMLSGFNVEVGLLISGMDKQYKQEIKEGLSKGEISVVVGTHALLQEDVEFRNLGLVVIDEQHKFGVKQREVLKQKGKIADYLIMTATPIPRTLALTLFGDMDISTIKEHPRGERNINTYWVSDEKRGNVYGFLRDMVKKGAQGFIVCPCIEDNPKNENKAVEKIYKEAKELLGTEEVLLLHGRMSSENKKDIIEKFQKGNVKVLVSTIVIEVGIDIPDASIMIIEDANRFGLSQLHQLRGRIGRSGQDAYCVLIADPKTEEATKRLDAMVNIDDGFTMSEEDLKIRGSGEFFGFKQHGFTDIKFQNISGQIDLLEQAQQEAFQLLGKDPSLKTPVNKELRKELNCRFPQI
ncbi:MAG: ATP-dependent DNA helicase RecG [Candidatus Saelkia tenebricola]|nr:ATP-dependent DNA helicase RecG [Candidatus Saelkia tenebricola]